ncbi:hypothetical protein K1719_027231 [Acacia pycnantha]|nr:hypothetical protein K1719_027231 [Acacia pycnantha]
MALQRRKLKPCVGIPDPENINTGLFFGSDREERSRIHFQVQRCGDFSPSRKGDIVSAETSRKKWLRSRIKSEAADLKCYQGRWYTIIDGGGGL